MEDLDTTWLDTLYREGFEVVFGSWMGSYSCPFLWVPKPPLSQVETNIVADLATLWPINMSVYLISAAILMGV
jgi:hypothetical protein